MRSSPSHADQELIARVAAEADVKVTPTQLERWRARGLLPRARIVRDRFGGSQVLPHDEDVLAAAAFLGRVSHRRRPWQDCAMDLFEAGFSLSPKALRESATFLIERQLAPMRKAWARAESEASPSEDPDEELAEIGERAAALLPRAVWRVVREEVALAHGHATAAQVREYLDRAMTWRLVDLNVPGRMTDAQRNLARHGVEEPMPVLGGPGIFPLPSERLVVATTLSWAEAEIAREFAYLDLEDNPSVASLGGPFVLMTWYVTAARRNSQPEALDTPLPQEELESQRGLLETLLSEGSTAHEPPAASEPDHLSQLIGTQGG